MWNTLFCLVILVPLCLPMQLNALRYTNMLSICITFFIVLTIISLSFKSDLFKDADD